MIGEVHAEGWRVAYADVFEADWLSTAVAERRARWVDLLPRLLAAPGHHVLVAESADRVIGFVHAGPSEDRDLGEVFALYVHPEWWGRGASAPLLASGIRHLRDDGVDTIGLWTLAVPGRARSFYDKVGLVFEGKTKERDFGEGREHGLVFYSAPSPEAE